MWCAWLNVLRDVLLFALPRAALRLESVLTDSTLGMSEDAVGEGLASFALLRGEDQLAMLEQLAQLPAGMLRAEHACALVDILGGAQLFARPQAAAADAPRLTRALEVSLALGACALPLLCRSPSHAHRISTLALALHSRAHALRGTHDLRAEQPPPPLHAQHLAVVAEAVAEALAAQQGEGPLGAVALATLLLDEVPLHARTSQQQQQQLQQQQQQAQQQQQDATRAHLLRTAAGVLQRCWAWLNAPSAGNASRARARAMLRCSLLGACTVLRDAESGDHVAKLWRVLAALTSLRATELSDLAARSTLCAELAPVLAAFGARSQSAAEALVASGEASLPPAGGAALFFAGQLREMATLASGCWPSKEESCWPSAAQPAAGGDGAADALALALLQRVAGCVGAFHTHAHELSIAAGPAPAAAARECGGRQAAAEAHAAAHRSIYDAALGAALRLPPARPQPAAQQPGVGGGFGGVWLAGRLASLAEAAAAAGARCPPQHARGLCLCLCSLATHAPALAAALEGAGHAPAAAKLRLLVASRCAPAALRLLARTQPRGARAAASLRGTLVGALRAHAGGAADARPALALLAALPAAAASPLAAEAVGAALAAAALATGAAPGAHAARAARPHCPLVAAGALALRLHMHELDAGADSGAESTDSEEEAAEAAAGSAPQRAAKASKAFACEASTLARALARAAAHSGGDLGARLAEGGGGRALDRAAGGPALWELLQLPRQPKGAPTLLPELALAARLARALGRAAAAPPSALAVLSQRQLLAEWLPRAAAELLGGWRAPAAGRAAAWSLAACAAQLLPGQPDAAGSGGALLPAHTIAALAAELPHALAHAAEHLARAPAGRRLLRALGAAVGAFVGARWLALDGALQAAAGALALRLREALDALGAQPLPAPQREEALLVACALADAAIRLCAALPHSALADGAPLVHAAAAGGSKARAEAEAEAGRLFGALLDCQLAGTAAGITASAGPAQLAVRRLERRAREAAAALSEFGLTADSRAVSAVASAIPAGAQERLRSSLARGPPPPAAGDPFAKRPRTAVAGGD
ncbi:hypothetical protein T492DRAFT_916979 [Pavlovales sp. CCMP2436]|nr:hypothetical protein T492DRAFT_916979 [Pavlovales sp. CCMP2436]